MIRKIAFFLLCVVLASPLITGTSRAQTGDVHQGLYVRGGVGLSDYTGDYPAQNSGHPFDLQELSRGSGLPVMFDGELGYHFSPAFAVAAGVQTGNYPIVGYGGGDGTVGDSWRYTPHLLGRYTFSTPYNGVSFYFDAGVNATFGGATSTGFGPSLGGGVNIPIRKTLSFYVESRFHGAVPDDAIDGNDRGRSVLGSMDSVNQLLGFGLKFSLTSPTPPRILVLDGPTTVKAGEVVAYTATVGDEARPPISYRWAMGDGTTHEGATASHVFTQAGTYEVILTARNKAGETTQTLVVEVLPPPRPARITSLQAAPDTVRQGERVHFSSRVQGASPIAHSWQFGDGASAEGASSVHAYEEVGEYTARLQVTNPDGQDDRTVTVRVEPTLPRICTTIRILNWVFFAPNSSTLTEADTSSLEENADLLMQCPNLTVEVRAFAAPGEQDPLALAQERANTVATFYENQGISPQRITRETRGLTKRIAPDTKIPIQYRRVDSIPKGTMENPDATPF